MINLNNFFHIRVFTNNNVSRMLALYMMVVLVGFVAPDVNAADFRFTVTADNRPSRELPGAFQHVLSQINTIFENKGQWGAFHISVGEI